VQVLSAIGHAAETVGSMSWQILWALVFGFYLSAMVEALVRKDTVARLLGNRRPRNIAIAAGLGAASSSCSYAAVALTRTLVRKGADFIAAMAFEIASTNLVIELGIILAVLLGWQFTLAEYWSHWPSEPLCPKSSSNRPGSRLTGVLPDGWRATRRWT